MDNGLKDISLKKLSDLVLISGKNGAGKTRFLNFISRVGEANDMLIQNYRSNRGNELGRFVRSFWKHGTEIILYWVLMAIFEV